MGYETDKQCPQCAGAVEYDLTCHTWPKYSEESGLTTWMSCLPCDSARTYYCVADSMCYCSLDTGVVEPNCYACDGTGIDEGWGCGWRYTDGLNPGNPRWEDNEQRRPEWI